ncbi:MAG: hypothetical protein RL641_101 [Candidatus Parcubacteria bacterium]|jgi:lipopolysaccharide transport system ATP-binding protein
MKPIIEVKNISKKYNISHQRGGYVALRDTLTTMLRNPFRFAKQKIKNSVQGKEIFWALKDINFSVQKGEVIGIIGRNGAGKSTLLKILSQITPPTTGEITLRGRVGSLLEVGTGFHPELTGRENIFLNGAILGMKKKEIAEKFDEIVAFADIDKFLDTPVKYYSSGMYVRLAFSVAAHMDPDILIIDEVLAVGDAEFQKKCLGKMNEITKKDGRTILFVSHNMNAIEQLCKRVIILNEGALIFDGPSTKGLKLYANKGLGLEQEKKWEIENAPGNAVVKTLRTFTHDAHFATSATFDITKEIGITIEYQVLEKGHIFTHGINLFNQDGTNVFNSHDVTSKQRLIQREKGMYASTVWIPGNTLSEGIFTVGIALFKPTPFILHILQENVLAFEVIDHVRGDSARGTYHGGFPGIVRPLLTWETKKYEK